MKIVKIVLIVIVAIVAMLVVVAPIGPLPGVFIGGTPTAAPAQWDTDSTHEVELRVPGALPRVVVIWVVQQENVLYVLGGMDSGWVTMLGQGGPVEMRLGDNTYALNATPLNQDWEPVMQAYLDKYRADYPDIVDQFPSIEEAGDQISVYRLDRV